MSQLLPPLIKLSTEPLPYPVAFGQQVYNTDTGTWQVYELDSNGLSGTWNTFADTLPDSFVTNAMLGSGVVNFAKLGADAAFRAQFEEAVLAICGATPLLWLPLSTDTTTSTDKSRNAKTITHAVSLANRQTALGLGVEISFDGINDYATIPDSDDLSPGDGTTDTAFTVFMLGKVNGDANLKTILAKYGGTANREWLFDFDATEKLRLSLYDESVDKTASKLADAATTTATNKLWVATYSAATGGATAGNDITLYENGLSVAATATNDPSYVAMENGTLSVAIGSTSGFGSKFNGSMEIAGYVAKALSADEVWRLYKACVGYFNFL